ncbi:pre-mRNA-splicing factor rse1 [Elasticomyces elasticus]|uniref:Pre-mRNA-splicing factor rse1 n=1 Tax=Elasticomyces elasticus TaxID=574655 RepID=A0AAN7WJR0_9PEZI|nr:pre-mRNA-splicing factor rse1 [Elasticomyces elasticus]
MSNVQQSQAFYSLTLSAPTATTAAVTTNSIPGLKTQDQQIFEARGSRIYLHRVIENEDRTEVKLQQVCEQDTFSIIRGVTSFRIPGTATDQLVIASDSGRISLVNYDAGKNQFKRVHLETFGKSGVRRTVPGQYLASDPRGRCCMLASAEKNKVVYIVNRNSAAEIVISSPHEANSWATLCFAVCALDTGWEHPVFAALEVDYNDAESDPTGDMYERREKMLVYYTVDLGLNHVVKSWSDAVDYTANMVFGVPGGQDGPSGCIVCCEDRIYYRHDKASPLCIPIPRRKGSTEDPERKRIIVSGCLHLSKARHEFFFLLQTEDGDVFKLTMEMAADNSSQPERLVMKYYDTFPVAKQMLLIRKGYIYIASENGNGKVYHVNDLADDPEVEPENCFNSDDVSADPEDATAAVYFTPRELKYTSLAVEVPGMHPLLRTKVDNPGNEDAPQIYALQGTGNQSQFKTLRHGLPINEIVSSPLGGVPFDNLWSLKTRAEDEFHSYLLLSSSQGEKTIVLSIGDEVETVENTLFLTSRPTLEAAQMGTDTLVQVHTRGVHSILSSEKTNAWQAPANRSIVAASANQHQLLLGLSSAELCYFFMGDDGILNQLEEMPEMSGRITCLSVGQTPVGLQQAKFAVVGCEDCTIRVLSIELDSPLEGRSVQALSAVPVSLEIVREAGVDVVHIGLVSGLYLRAVIDGVTGELGEVRTKFLGASPTKIFPVGVPGGEAEEGGQQQGVLACSTRPWLGYVHPGSGLYTLTPLVAAEAMLAARPFVSEHLNGLCAIQGANLVIFGIPSVEGRLAEDIVGLRYTPRGMARNPWGNVWYVVQSEGNTLSAATKQGLREKNKAVMAEGEDDAMNGEGEEEVEVMEKHLGLSRSAGHWASCVQAIDPVGDKAATCTIELEGNEAALCCAVVAFESGEWEVYLAVGTGQHMMPGVAAASVTGEPAKGYVHIYRLTDAGRTMELVHKTPFAAPIYALHAFQGRLALGVGPELFVYDMGMKNLLRKSRGVVVPNQIVSIDSLGNRLVCADVSESVTYVVFKPKHNRMIGFVDDSIQRWSTTASMLDYETVAGGDKFGNLWVVRCPEQASKESDEEGIGGYIVNERSYLGGAPYRLELRSHFFTQDVALSIQRTALVPGGQEVLFWSGLQGTLGMMVPFVSREDVEFFTQLEQLLRAEDAAALVGRDHLMYRGYYVPVKGVVDGDLCERFLGLSVDGKAKIAAEVEREVREVERKVVEMRTRVAF